jgi:hypothetical protein
VISSGTPKGKWVTEAPTQCPNGHPLRANQVLIAHVACLGHVGGGHPVALPTCDSVVDGPPLPRRLYARNATWSTRGECL